MFEFESNVATLREVVLFSNTVGLPVLALVPDSATALTVPSEFITIKSPLLKAPLAVAVRVPALEPSLSAAGAHSLPLHFNT